MPQAALTRPAEGQDQGKVEPRRPGRPKGSRSPLARWLLAEIGQRKREGYTCHDAFYILMNEHEPDGSDGLVVSDDVADDVWRVVGGDIAGRHVTYEWFRKLWREP